MPGTYLISDTHFGHKGVCHFTQADGVTPLRPWDDPDEMNEDMIERWNSVVKPNDLVYHLGDVVINRRYLNLVLPRLNGRKKLVRGNHDLFRLRDYTPHFEDILGVQVMADCIMSHIPLHRDSITSRFKVNVHGHTHSNVVMMPNPHLGQYRHGEDIDTTSVSVPDPKYICVCVEQINYTPVSYDEIRERINAT